MRDIKDYSSKYVSNEMSFETHQVEFRRLKVIEQVNKYNHSTIVEIGCGTEPFFEYFNTFEKMIIIEPSDIFFKIATEKALKKNNVKLINSFFEDVDLLEENIDIILLSSLLHEIKDTKLFLKQILSKCSESTVIHINVPNSNSFHRLLAYESGLIDSPSEFSNNNHKFQVNNVFNLDSLEELVGSVGFEVLDKGSYFVKPFTHGQMKNVIDNNIIDVNILNGLNNMIKYMPDLGSEIFVDVRIKKI